MILEALFLGLSTGTYCIISCAPVAIPFLFSEEIKDRKQNAIYVALILIGRLIAYIIAGAIIGAIGGFAVKYLDPVLQGKFAAFAYLFIGIVLLLTGLMYNFPALKLCKKYGKVYSTKIAAFTFGILTGLSLCPPFFAAASRVFGAGSSLSGILYFFMFYLGTTVYFLPLFGIHIFKKHLKTMQMIARMTMILLGVYFLLARGILGLI